MIKLRLSISDELTTFLDALAQTEGPAAGFVLIKAISTFAKTGEENTTELSPMGIAIFNQAKKDVLKRAALSRAGKLGGRPKGRSTRPLLKKGKNNLPNPSSYKKTTSSAHTQQQCPNTKPLPSLNPNDHVNPKSTKPKSKSIKPSTGAFSIPNSTGKNMSTKPNNSTVANPQPAPDAADTLDKLGLSPEQKEKLLKAQAILLRNREKYVKDDLPKPLGNPEKYAATPKSEPYKKANIPPIKAQILPKPKPAPEPPLFDTDEPTNWETLYAHMADTVTETDFDVPAPVDKPSTPAFTSQPRPEEEEEVDYPTPKNAEEEWQALMDAYPKTWHKTPLERGYFFYATARNQNKIPKFAIIWNALLDFIEMWEEKQTSPEYIPSLLNWLKQERYNDENVVSRFNTPCEVKYATFQQDNGWPVGYNPNGHYGENWGK